MSTSVPIAQVLTREFKERYLREHNRAQDASDISEILFEGVIVTIINPGSSVDQEIVAGKPQEKVSENRHFDSVLVLVPDVVNTLFMTIHFYEGEGTFRADQPWF